MTDCFAVMTDKPRTAPCSPPRFPGGRHAESLPFPHLTGYWVNRVGAAFRTALDRELRDFDLTRRQVGTLMHVYYGGARTAAELTRSLQVDSTAVTRMIDRLEEKGLLERSPDPEDGRRHLLSIPPEAERLLPRLVEVGRTVEGRFEADIPAEDLVTFHRVLIQMLENVGEPLTAIHIQEDGE